MYYTKTSDEGISSLSTLIDIITCDKNVLNNFYLNLVTFLKSK